MKEATENRLKFYQYVIPSIGSMLVTGLYFVVDGMFVGRGVGPAGMAAVNLATPFISLLTTVTMMITMGGATLSAIHLGRSQNKEANDVFQQSMGMTIFFSLCMTVVSLLFATPIAGLLGASGSLIADTAVYMRYYVAFGIFFCSSMTLSAFVRNDGNPKLAFWGMIAGAVSNVFLDWLFIFPLQLGLRGAAVASGWGRSCPAPSFSPISFGKEAFFGCVCRSSKGILSPKSFRWGPQSLLPRSDALSPSSATISSRQSCWETPGWRPLQWYPI